MKPLRQHPQRLVLAGPPGGVGTVILLIVVGAAMTGGGALFALADLGDAGLMPRIAGWLIGLVGVAILVGGVGNAFARDRLELDQVTGRGRWSRRLLGRDLQNPIDFALEHAKRVQLEYFTESSCSDTGPSTVNKVRARLLLTKPRRAILLAEAERSRADRIRATAATVADFLGQELEVADDAR
jgi:hypothetical protein